MLSTPHEVRKDALEEVDSTASLSPAVKSGVAVVLLIVAATAIGVFRSSLGIGFLLDDFSHLDCSYAFGHGDLSQLAKSFTGNWTGAADNLTAYRPFISLSYCLDYLVWGLNPFGYHLSNLLMFAGCSILASLLMFELSAAFCAGTMRAALALATGVLFAVYPLHPEAVAWVIGRVDVQCALFYFSSLYLYLLFRRSNSSLGLVASLVFFACALPSKEMAVTLPVVVALAEFLLPARELGWRPANVQKRIAYVALYLLMLLTFALIRTCALHTLVGGYGSGGLKAFLQLWRNFLDQATWLKVVYGANEEVPAAGWLARLVWTAFGGLAVLLLLRLGEGRAYWRTLAFISIAAAVSELPTFQIWHVFPNLCGSRLLFIPSVLLCMLLSMTALPAFRLWKRSATIGKVLPVAGALLLICVGYVWTVTLTDNLTPWVSAGNQMRALAAQIHAMAGSTPPGKVSLLLDLPQDLSGAGMLGRPEFLDELLRPPLGSAAERGKVITSERPIPGSHDYAYPHLLERLVSTPAVQAVYRWDTSRGVYEAWQHPDGANEARWTTDKIPAGASAQTVWLPAGKFDPFKLQVIYFTTKTSSKSEGGAIAPRIRLIWRSENQPASWIDYSEGPVGQSIGGSLVFVPSRFRTWLFNGSIRQIGFKVDAGAGVEGAEVRAGSDSALIPEFKLDSENGGRAQFDCRNVAGAKHALLFATVSGIAFPDPAGIWMLPKQQIADRVALDSLSGSIDLPAKIFEQPGMHQVCVVAVDSAGKPVGLMSEPLSIEAGAK